MAFCGQCGFILPPKVTACPRCNATVVSVDDTETQNPDNPTIISALEKTGGSGNIYDTELDLMQQSNPFASSDILTKRIEPGTKTPGSISALHTSFPENHSHTPIPPQPSYLLRSDSSFTASQGGPYPGYAPGPVFPNNPNIGPSPISPQKTKSQGIVLVMLLVLFLIVMISGAIFVIGPDRVLQAVTGRNDDSQPPIQVTISALPPTPPPQVPTPTPVITLTPEQQGRSVVDRYFTAINSKDYQTAYNLWVNYPDSYQKFANGFATTQHDDYQFDQILKQSDGAVQVNVTVVATTTSSQQTTYQGYYIVGRQADGSWKIITATLKPV